MRTTGCGVLCYANVEGKTLLLLGREKETPGWNQGSCKWSGFSGRIEQGESPERGAAREFIEESCAAVALDGSEDPPDAAELERTLGTMKVIDRSAESSTTHRTYLVQVPCAPFPERFAATRRALSELDATFSAYRHLKKSRHVPRLFLPGFVAGDLVVTDFGVHDGDVVTELRSASECVHLSFAVTPSMTNDVALLRASWDSVLEACSSSLLLAHPAVHVHWCQGAVVAAYVDKGYLEKSELAWWTLEDVVRLTEEGMAADFRSGFLDVLEHALPALRAEESEASSAASARAARREDVLNGLPFFPPGNK